MAFLKDLIVYGASRFIGDVQGSKFIVNGATSSLFLKGDGTLDSNTYLTLTDLVLPDWDQTDTTSKDYIKNKPTIPDNLLSANYEMSSDSNEDLALEAGDTYEEAFAKIEKAINDNEYVTSSALTELDQRINAIPDPVKPDWNALPGSSAEILNKPVIPNNLADVATSGSYNDLTDTPTIPAAQVNSDWNAISGAAQILNKPTIPTTYAASATAAGPADKAVSIPYAEVDSTSTATAFTATVDGISELRDGVCVYLKNGIIASAEGYTININNLGAKPVYDNHSSVSPTGFGLEDTLLFVYNSSRIEEGCWDYYAGNIGTTNTTAYLVRSNYLRLLMADKTYRYRILFTSVDGTLYVPANTATSTNATASRAVNQREINPFGRIVYYGYTAIVQAGSMPAAAYMRDQSTLTLGYSFNRTGSALTLTLWKPVYIKCAPQSDGGAIIDADTPYVQDLPTSEDGKIYIFLGVAYSATAIEMLIHHPIYYYKDGAIRQWTGAEQRIESLEQRIAALEAMLNNS